MTLPITDGLVAEYNFVQGESPTTLYDISGNGHHGTCIGRQNQEERFDTLGVGEGAPAGRRLVEPHLLDLAGQSDVRPRDR